MADRVWPTEPWYVFRTAPASDQERYQDDFSFFIEHTHRIAGWTVVLLVTVLALGVWWTEPRKTARWVALVGLFVLIAGFGAFHGGLIAQRDTPARELRLPTAETVVTLAGFALVLGVAVSGLVARQRGSGVRFLALLALVAVMIQGLLGGFRVKLNELVGADLAAFHGVFAQVVLGLLVWVAVATAPRGVPLSAGPEARRLHRWTVVLAHLVFLQVVFGALVRHFPTPLDQRLHFLTAFAATALAVLVIRAVLMNPAAVPRRSFRHGAGGPRAWCNCTSAWRRGWPGSVNTRCRNWSK